MAKTISIKTVNDIVKGGFIAANAILAGLHTDKTHTFIKNGVEHSFMDDDININKIVTVTEGAKIRHRSLPTVPSLSADRIFRESFAGRKGFGFRGHQYDVELRESMTALFNYISKYHEHLRVDMEVTEDKSLGCERLDMYVESTNLPADRTIRISISVLDVVVHRVSRGRYPFAV